jgi:hypothetical protein
MKNIVMFKFKSGGDFLAELEEREPEGGMERAALAGAVVTDALETFESALAKIRPIAETVMEELRGLKGPTAVEVCFGIKLSASAGVVLAAAATEANFGVKLSWSRTDSPK